MTNRRKNDPRPGSICNSKKEIRDRVGSEKRKGYMGKKQTSKFYSSKDVKER